MADEMLGTLAKWLRILGFDTEYAKGMDDTAILKACEEEGRTLLTRDRELHQRALKRGIGALYLGDASLEDDLRAVISAYPPDPGLFMSRCTVCNSELEGVEKEEVRGKVPDGVFERQNRFRYCLKCDKYYWEGSHHEKMREFLDEIRAQREKDYL